MSIFSISKFSTPRIAAAVLLGGALIGSPTIAFANSQKVNGQLAQFVSVYHQRKSQIRSSAEEGIIAQACIETVFQDWSDANLKMLHKAEGLDVKAIGQPLTDFGRALKNSQRNTAALDFIAQGLIANIRKQRDLLVAQAPELALHSEQFSPDNWQANVFLLNTQKCMTPALVGAVKSAINFDLTRDVPPEIANAGQQNLAWQRSAFGGVDLEGEAYSDDGGIVASVSIEIDSDPSASVATPELIENRTFTPFTKAISAQDFFDVMRSN